MDELEALMAEPPGGHNHGRVARGGNPPPAEGDMVDTVSPRELDTEFWRALTALGSGERSFLSDPERGGRVVDVDAGGGYTGVGSVGMVAHRGVLHPDEYVHVDELIERVEALFGFTREEVRSVYARDALGGPIPQNLRELRDAIDARVLALSRAGGNIDLLRRIMGLNPTTLKRALSRARGKES